MRRQQTLLMLDQFLQASPGDKLHLEEPIAARFSDGMRGDDVRMHECGSRASFGDKPLAVFDVRLPDAGRQDFKGTIPPEVLVMSQIDPPHRPAPQEGLATINMKLGANQLVLLLFDLVGTPRLSCPRRRLTEEKRSGQLGRPDPQDGGPAPRTTLSVAGLHEAFVARGAVDGGDPQREDVCSFNLAKLK